MVLPRRLPALSRNLSHTSAAIRAELALYITHGVLHACGFDDIDDDDRRQMRAAERAVLHALGYRIAPVDAP